MKGIYYSSSCPGPRLSGVCRSITSLLLFVVEPSTPFIILSLFTQSYHLFFLSSVPPPTHLHPPLFSLHRYSTRKEETHNLRVVDNQSRLTFVGWSHVFVHCFDDNYKVLCSFIDSDNVSLLILIRYKQFNVFLSVFIDNRSLAGWNDPLASYDSLTSY